MTLKDALDKHINIFAPQTTYPKENEITLTASFVIPVFNSALTIRAVVDTILRLKRADLIQEIVLVNDGSTDESLTIMNMIAKNTPGVKVLVIDNGERRHAAYSRNRGIEHCTGDLVFFIDSDIMLPNDYLIHHARHQQAEGPCITFSLRKNIESLADVQFPVTSADGDFRASILEENTIHDKPFNFCETHNLAEMCLTCAVVYRRSDLEAVKGCPENFIGWGFNDTAMATKVIALGRHVAPIFEATVCHLAHVSRSGNASKKWAEFRLNRRRYQKMLELSPQEAFQYKVKALEI